jgi:hypothetical protein
VSKTVAPTITRVVISNLATLIEENLFLAQSTALCLRVLDFLHTGAQQIAASEVAGTISNQGPAALNLSALGNLQALLSCQEKSELRLADGPQLSTQTNRRQFLGELLRDCGFFAHLVFRQVRAGGRPSSRSARKKSNVVKLSQTPPRSSSNVLPKRLPVEAPGLQPEAPLTLLQTLWVELGCRHLQILACEKEGHEYGEDSKPAL